MSTARKYASLPDIDSIIQEADVSDEDKQIARMYFFNDAFPESAAHELSEHELKAFVQVYDSAVASSHEPTQNQRSGYDLALDRLEQLYWPSW